MYENLKKLRLSLGFNQEEFGALFGIKKTTYSGYETGASDPKSDFWIAVAERFHVSIDYLMDFSDDPHQTKYADKSKIEASYCSLDEYGRRMVDAIMEIEAERFASQLNNPNILDNNENNC